MSWSSNLDNYVSQFQACAAKFSGVYGEFTEFRGVIRYLTDLHYPPEVPRR